MKTLHYKGYQASVEFEDNALFVKVLHIDDLLVAQIDKASETEAAFEDLIEAYFKDCAEEGRAPGQPFKGSFNVRLTPELHRQVAMRAAEEGVSLNKWIVQTIEERLRPANNAPDESGLWGAIPATVRKKRAAIL